MKLELSDGQGFSTINNKMESHLESTYQAL